MKKIIVILISLIAFTIFSCVVLSTPNKVLYFLNWGEYIDTELLRKFEREYNCQVVLEMVTSSETMYQKIVSGTTNYDIAVPGDYVVSQLYDEGYLLPFDVKNQNYENLYMYEDLFVDNLSSLMAKYMVDKKTGKEYNDHFLPYFYGAYSIIYSEKKADVPSIIKADGFKALYERDKYKEEVRIGMYDTARWVVASSLMAEGYDPNITSFNGSKEGDIDNELKDWLIKRLKAAKFDEFGNDSMKRNVANGSLDMCYTQLGDFFDTLYLVYSESQEKTVIDFNVSVPKTTAGFFDSLIIPTTCQNYNLANAFANFMMDEDNAYQNACSIGYSPTLKSVVDRYNEEAENGAYYFGGPGIPNSLLLKDFLKKYPMYLSPLGDVVNPFILEQKPTSYLSTCETIFTSLA